MYTLAKPNVISTYEGESMRKQDNAKLKREVSGTHNVGENYEFPQQ